MIYTMEDIAIVGRKTFFIAPVTEQMPETNLERLLSHGYEAYCIADDGICSLQKKVEAIIDLFPGSILFFHVDSMVSGIDWKSYIKQLCGANRDVKIGITYAARESGKERSAIEDYYSNEARVSCGTLAFTSDKDGNYELILSTLAHAGARGRRDIIRATCDSSSEARFPTATARIKDVNKSYFCCLFDKEQTSFHIYERFHNITMNINGMSFVSDAVLIMKHIRDGVNTYIFMFVREDGSTNLEQDQKQKLNKKIYQVITGERIRLMNDTFSKK